MPKAPPLFRPSHAPTRQEQNRAHDQRRGSARQRGYTGRWDKARLTHLDREPLCQYCALNGLIEPATVVDHLYPHRTYVGVFWRTEWWVSSCDPCHVGFKQAVERQGKAALDTLAARLGRPILAEG